MVCAGGPSTPLPKTLLPTTNDEGEQALGWEAELQWGEKEAVEKLTHKQDHFRGWQARWRVGWGVRGLPWSGTALWPCWVTTW